jgi:hypothetical protein
MMVLLDISLIFFCPPHGTWEVSESLEDVVKELNSLEWNKK